MIPSYFKIEIMAIRDEIVTQGHKGLKVETWPIIEWGCDIIYLRSNASSFVEFGQD